jgi:hypothetical protein
MILFAVEAKDSVLRVADFLEGLKDAEVYQDGTLKDQRRRLEGGGVNESQSKFIDGTRPIS